MAEGTATIEFVDAPTEVDEDESADFQVRMRLTGVSASGPYQITQLALREYDGLIYTTIEEHNNEFQIPQLNKWYNYTFKGNTISDYESDSNAELFAYVKFSDKNPFSFDPSDFTPRHDVLIISPRVTVLSFRNGTSSSSSEISSREG